MNKREDEGFVKMARWFLALVILGLSLFCLLAYWIIEESESGKRQGDIGLSGKVFNGSVYINGTASIAKTDDHFICATLDWGPPEHCDHGTCWGNGTLLNLVSRVPRDRWIVAEPLKGLLQALKNLFQCLKQSPKDLNSTILLNSIKAFSPLRIRMGGTLQDRVTYQREGDQKPCNPIRVDKTEFLGFTEGCLPLSRWDELNAFSRKTGAIVTFGLNALYGRTVKPDRSVLGPWNSSDAESLLRYTVNKGYPIYGWELGNELSGNGIGARLSVEQYASDLESLQNLMNDIYKDYEVKPLILAPGGFFDHDWFKNFVNQTAQTLQVATHHIYNLGGGDDPHLINKILDPSYLDGVAQTFKSLSRILTDSNTTAVAWVSEAGGAHNSGRHGVTDAFASNFWYLDQLGLAAIHDTKTYCRQTLIGGGYGLLNTTTFLPNPDYYSALLWHRLMGRNVLSTNFISTKKLRAYSHCSKISPGITLVLINLNRETNVQAKISVEDVSDNGTLILQQGQQPQSSKLAGIPSGSSIFERNTREEYHLTTENGDLSSQVTFLNGRILSVNSWGEIPPLNPIKGGLFDPISVDPFSVVFVHFPSLNITACR